MIGGDCAGELVQGPHDRQSRMECGMAGSGAGARYSRSLCRWREFAGDGVEGEYEDAIQSFVGHHHETPRWVEDHLVRMGSSLLYTVRSGRPGEGDHLG